MNETVTISNRSLQMLPLQVRGIGDDFYTEEQIRLEPGMSCTINRSYLNNDQANNLVAMGLLTISTAS